MIDAGTLYVPAGGAAPQVPTITSLPPTDEEKITIRIRFHESGSLPLLIMPFAIRNPNIGPFVYLISDS